jgi:hypothetical protein
MVPGAAGRPIFPVVKISDLEGYGAAQQRTSNGNQKPMMAMPKIVKDSPIGVLV